MPETTCLDGFCNGFELDFVERVATPKRAMKLEIHLHFAGLSFLNTVCNLENLGVSRARSTVHNWVQKADLEPRAGRALDKIALDETVIKVNGERYRPNAAVDPKQT